MSCCPNPAKTSAKQNRRPRFKDKELIDPMSGEKYIGQVPDGYDVTLVEYCNNCLHVFGSHDEKE